ncbi:MAG: hypothetical protein IPO07_31555 [Haliscomenobacter sp.]|nr:hypothetical protein [Haliscomenobacter sp.]MBK9492812.1 hypothetical protein [Haliscomenobacter sp.]
MCASSRKRSQTSSFWIERYGGENGESGDELVVNEVEWRRSNCGWRGMWWRRF